MSMSYYYSCPWCGFKFASQCKQLHVESIAKNYVELLKTTKDPFRILERQKEEEPERDQPETD